MRVEDAAGSDHVVILPGCVDPAPGQLSVECRAPLSLLSTALVWTVVTILGHQTNPHHNIVVDAPRHSLKSIFIINAEPDCTCLFLISALDKCGRQNQAIRN